MEGPHRAAGCLVAGMKPWLFAFILFAVCLAASAQDPATGPKQPEVSLITILPGKALYSSFGHTAIRVVYGGAGADVLYNYGLSAHPFDLKFALGMLAGRMEFMVGIIDTRVALDYYSRVENRTIIEQRLDLSEGQKAQILARLGHDSLPANRNYNYRYFTDNCATRVWDILNSGELGIAAASPAPSRLPLRASVGGTLANRPWLRLGIDILLGPEADRAPRPDAKVFLPGALMDWTAAAMNPAGAGRGLSGPGEVLYEARPAPKGRGDGLGVLIISIAMIACSLLIGILLRRDHPLALAFDALLFGAAAVVGLAIALFWFGAGYGEVGMNLNLLWAGILPLIGLMCSRRHAGARFVTILFWVSCVAAGLAAAFGGFGIQSISPSIRLIAATVMLRSFFRAIPEKSLVPLSERGGLARGPENS